MDYRLLGRTGLEVSAVGLGGWATVGERVDVEETVRLLAAGRDAGITVLDNAETYGDGRSEEVLGQALRRLGWPRATYVVCTKLYWGTHGGRPGSWGLGRKHLREGCDAALERLGLDHVDLLLCHRADPRTPLAETVEAMSDLVRQGKTLYWGTSEWPASLVVEAKDLAVAHGWAEPVTEQLQYNLLHTQRVEGEFAELLDEGLGLMTWSPLAYGLLARDPGTTTRLDRPGYEWLADEAFPDGWTAGLRRVAAFHAAARERGVTPAGLALSWVLGHPHVHVALTGASSAAQLQRTLAALDALRPLDAGERRRLQALVEGAAKSKIDLST